MSQLCSIYAGIGHVGDVHTHNLVPPREVEDLKEESDSHGFEFSPPLGLLKSIIFQYRPC